MKMPSLTFLNHASFAIETEHSVLLIDPWFEGKAFHDGWELLDSSISNSEIISKFCETDKTLYVWYSHEHSDHLSFSFLKGIKSSLNESRVSILYQKTLDGRVAKTLRNYGFSVLEQANGRCLMLDEDLSITTWKWSGGDSLSVMKAGDITILNLNDCVVSTSRSASSLYRKISKFYPRIDILFTQFGYANWIGNEQDEVLREQSSSEKLDRILLQNKALCPGLIIPFASYISFCNQENFYMNDKQNSPQVLRASRKLCQIQNKIAFMKPFDVFNLDSLDLIKSSLDKSTRDAEKFWNDKYNNIFVKTKPVQKDLEEIVSLFRRYQKIVRANLGFLPEICEILGLVRPIHIFIYDHGCAYRVSYISGMKRVVEKDFDLKISSDVLAFTLQHEYGFNTTSVNARFRTGENAINLKNTLVNFFAFQEFIKNGYTIRRPVLLGVLLVRSAIKLISRKFSYSS